MAIFSWNADGCLIEKMNQASCYDMTEQYGEYIGKQLNIRHTTISISTMQMNAMHFSVYEFFVISSHIFDPDFHDTHTYYKL